MQARVGKYKSEIQAAAKAYPNVKPELIASVMMRETRARNIIGDKGHGHGLMQIDNRSFGGWLSSHKNGMDPASNIMKGASILSDNLKHYHGNEAKAVAAYNAGFHNVDKAVRRGFSPDRYTTQHNYSRDVMAHEGWFHDMFTGQ